MILDDKMRNHVGNDIRQECDRGRSSVYVSPLFGLYEVHEQTELPCVFSVMLEEILK